MVQVTLNRLAKSGSAIDGDLIVICSLVKLPLMAATDITKAGPRVKEKSKSDS